MPRFKLCMKYELKINDKKTEVNDFPYIHPQNKDFIFNYFKNYQIVKMKLGL
ncbi:hypothetical protein ACV56Z_00350 [Staphylococcus aureus]